MKSFPNQAWETSADALDFGKIVVDPLITHRFSLEQTEEAVVLLSSKNSNAHKILIFPNGMK